MFEAVPRSETVLPPSAPENRYKLPGFGLPLDYNPETKDAYGINHRSLFPSALDDRDIDRGYINQPLTTLREVTMMDLMDQFTDLPNWTSKASVENPHTSMTSN
ncbi:hypothetical protein VTN77DRAFT_1543 [Rasamsonia byssochlamydoides]|uniref:uncharacterized protein n=1 Tax=Rasamsonia byssochlamydoides TaxID=89139 RepID=UPI00374314C3